MSEGGILVSGVSPAHAMLVLLVRPRDSFLIALNSACSE